MEMNPIIDIYIAVFMFFLFLSTRNKSMKSSLSTRRFGYMVLHLFVLLLTDAASWSFLQHPNPHGTRFIFVFQYIMTMALVLEYSLYLKYLFVEYYHIGLWGDEKLFRIVMFVSDGLWLLSIPFNWFYTIFPDGSYALTPFYVVSQLGAVLMLIPSGVGIIRNIKRLGRKNSFLWLFFMLVPLFARPIDLLLDIPMLFPTMALTAFIVYSQINVEMARALKNKELELQDSNQKIMVSQIQPHFLYNVLNSIVYLIRKDPRAAEETTNDFASYLRMNLNAISKTNPVRFEEELVHVETYLKLEKVRFGEELNVAYDIRVHDFYLPVLSIQPLVENAVKHGVCQKDGGGTVTLKTWDDDNYFYVSISDDGVGFDTSRDSFNDGRSHIGMANTRKRIQEQCSGEVSVESTVGVGTIAVIKLPKSINATCRPKE